MTGNELAVIDGETRDLDLVPAFVMSVQQAKQQLLQLQSFVREVMVKDEDYGVIPGTEKPTLLKPGAEKLNEIYGYAPELDTSNRVEDWAGGFFHYEVKCRLVSKRTGRIVAEGVGSCNSKEKRYNDRWVFKSDLPDTLTQDEIGHLKTKEIVSRKNGQKYTMYLWRNEDIFTLVNTILKMAKKRALVDATLSATRSSGIFTQDMEDIVDAPRPAPAPTMNRAPSQPERPPRPNGTMVQTPPPGPPKAEAEESADEIYAGRQRAWDRWLALTAEADSLGIEYSPLGDHVTRQVIVDHGKELAEQVKAMQVKAMKAQQQAMP